MRSKLVHESEGMRTFVLVLETGDEVMACLLDFAQKQKLSGASFQAIGAFHGATLGYFHWEKKDYKRIPVHEQVEVLSLIGDVAEKDGQPKLHAHVVLGRSDASTLGGHLLEAHVRPTLEVVLIETPAHLRKAHDELSGLALIRL